MIKQKIIYKTSLKVNKSVKGETIEEKVERIINNQEGIDDTVEIIYTDRRDGVKPEYNIRTDRWDLAIEASDIASKINLAKREDYFNQKMEKPGSPKDESTQATE